MTFRLCKKSKIFTWFCQIMFSDLLCFPHETFLSLVDKMFHHAQFYISYFSCTGFLWGELWDCEVTVGAAVVTHTSEGIIEG